MWLTSGRSCFAISQRRGYSKTSWSNQKASRTAIWSYNNWTHLTMRWLTNIPASHLYWRKMANHETNSIKSSSRLLSHLTKSFWASRMSHRRKTEFSTFSATCLASMPMIGRLRSKSFIKSESKVSNSCSQMPQLSISTTSQTRWELCNLKSSFLLKKSKTSHSTWAKWLWVTSLGRPSPLHSCCLRRSCRVRWRNKHAELSWLWSPK